MKNLNKILALSLVGSLLLGGCVDPYAYGPKQTGGAIIGGVAGGLLGSTIGGGTGRLAATAGLTVLGMILGSETGRSLDRADRLAMVQNTQNALEYNQTGQPMVWQNRQVVTTVVPTNTYQVNNRYCREYQTDVTIGGEVKHAYGRACRQPDGSWEIINQQESSAVPVVIQRQIIVDRTRYVHDYDPYYPAYVNLGVGYQERLRWERRHGYGWHHWH